MEQINKYNFSLFGGYILITILVVGLYLLWNENQSLKSTLLQVTNQLGVVNEENQKLQQIILQTQQTAKTQSTQKLEKNVDRKTKDIAKIKEQTTKANSKEIVIVLPENEKNYAKVIPTGVPRPRAVLRQSIQRLFLVLPRGSPRCFRRTRPGTAGAPPRTSTRARSDAARAARKTRHR